MHMNVILINIPVCEDGFYGSYCSQKCGHCRNDEPCNKDTGHCYRGCQLHSQFPLFQGNYNIIQMRCR